MPSAFALAGSSESFTALVRNEYCECTCRWTNSAAMAKRGLPRDRQRPMGRSSVEQPQGGVRLSVAGLALRPKLGLAQGLRIRPPRLWRLSFEVKVMLQSSRFFAILLGVALATP